MKEPGYVGDGQQEAGGIELDVERLRQIFKWSSKE
jgi:hypothetical protein